MPAAFAPDERGPTTVVEILEAMTDPESPVGLANRRAWVTPRGVEERSYVDLTKGMHAVRRPPELFAAVAFYNGWQFPWSIRALESSPELCRAMGITFPQSEQLQAAGAALRQTRVRWGNILQSEEINQLEAARHIESNLTGSTPDAVEEAGGAREAYGDIRRNQIDPQ